MKDMSKLPNRAALEGDYGNARNGAAYLKLGGRAFTVMFSDGGGWDHVSLSTVGRCPTWEEMCAVKEMFFEPEDVVVQFHPREREYRNFHPTCLHLWRCQFAEFPTPDPEFVAPGEPTDAQLAVAVRAGMSPNLARDIKNRRKG
jgi:hypothetical protein